MDIKITNENGKVSLFAPYHPDMPARAKAVGGKWLGGAWRFDPRDEQRIRDLATEIYGYGQPTTTVQYTIDNSVRSHDEPELVMFGRIIAKRPSRDAAVKLGDDVIIVEGKFPSSGGSSKHPSITGRSGNPVVLEIRNVPVNLINMDDPLVKVIEEVQEQNPLAGYTDEQILAEMKRRGLSL